MTRAKKIYCQRCKHFYVTWDNNHPKGCTAYGIKTRYTPSVMVFRATGKRCACYSPREHYKGT